MLEVKPEVHAADEEAALRSKPWGAVALCVVAVFIVLAIWFLFYFLAFLPRGLIR